MVKPNTQYYRCGQKETQQGRGPFPPNPKSMGGQACAIPTVGAPAAAIHMAERPRGTRAAREKSQCSVPKFTKMHPRGAFNVNPSGFTLKTLQDLRCVLLDPPQRNFVTLPKSEICTPQIRPAKFVIRIQKFWVKASTPPPVENERGFPRSF